jgi:hypothetical protein
MKETSSTIDLRDALSDGDRRTLAAVLTHLTGDVNAVPDPSDRQGILALAQEVLPPYVTGERRAEPVSDVVLQASMNLAAGGDVPAKYGPFVREQMGIGPAAPPRPIAPRKALSIVIIGAGVTGLALAVNLDRVGLHDYTILDKNSEVGGTWFMNRYPGCRVDTPSLLYSYSFNIDPGWPLHFRAYAEPLHAESLIGMPPTILVTAGLDPLKDEGAAYASRLRDAGTEVTFDCVEGAIHGFLSMPSISPRANSLLSHYITAFADLLHRVEHRGSEDSPRSPSGVITRSAP